MTEFHYRVIGGRGCLYAVGYDRDGADLILSFGKGVCGQLRLGRRILPLSDGAAHFPRETLAGADGACEVLLFLPGKTVPCTPIRTGRGGSVGASEDALALGAVLVSLDDRLCAAEAKAAVLEERLGRATVL